MVAAIQQLTEEQIERLSLDECQRLRREAQAQLSVFYSTNPAVLSRVVTRLNERLIDRFKADDPHDE